MRKVAIIGTGWAERVQIPAFLAAGLDVVGVAGRDKSKTARIAEAYGVPVATTDWRELLTLDCELVSVTSPPWLHAEQALAVLAAGKHLLCEKPLALTAAEAERMTQAARARPDLLALVDHELRFVPARVKAKELIDAGLLGRVLTVTARVASDMRIDPDMPYSWWSDAGRGGGILGAIGSHVLDGIRWLLAESCGKITVAGGALGVVYSERKDKSGKPRQVTADEIISASFTMGEAVGTLLIHGAALTETVDTLFIRGTEGTLVIDTSLKLYVSKGKRPLKEYVSPLPGTVPYRFRSSPFAAGTVLLGRALAEAPAEDPWREGLALRRAATLEDGLAVQRLIDEIRAFAARARGREAVQGEPVQGEPG
ncbi:Gfo/Idh/MocA family oxidoreductase [soil metagenome]